MSVNIATGCLPLNITSCINLDNAVGFLVGKMTAFFDSDDEVIGYVSILSIKRINEPFIPFNW